MSSFALALYGDETVYLLAFVCIVGFFVVTGVLLLVDYLRKKFKK